jgi:hypothetical protein
MRLSPLLAVVFLSGCTASVPAVHEIGEAILLPPGEMQEEEIMTGTGRTFVGKLSTVGALNSRRSFVSDYHGGVSVTVFPSRKIDCRFWTEGRITDKSVYDGANGFIESFSTLCTGRMQKDGSFEFQGAFLFDGPGTVQSGNLIDASEDEEQTFTMKGSVQEDEIIGDIIIGGLFRNAVVISDPKTMIDTGEGLRFTAAELP